MNQFGLFGTDPWWLVIVKVLGIFVMLVLLTLFTIWWERRVVSRMQNRIGPNRVGPQGLLQSLMDGVKLALKEEILPKAAHRAVYWIAPVISATTPAATSLEGSAPSMATPKSATTTRAPSAAQARATARPIPRPAPVTATTLSCRNPLNSSPVGHSGSTAAPSMRPCRARISSRPVSDGPSEPSMRPSGGLSCRTDLTQRQIPHPGPGFCWGGRDGGRDVSG